MVRYLYFRILEFPLIKFGIWRSLSTKCPAIWRLFTYIVDLLHMSFKPSSHPYLPYLLTSKRYATNVFSIWIGTYINFDESMFRCMTSFRCSEAAETTDTTWGIVAGLSSPIPRCPERPDVGNFRIDAFAPHGIPPTAPMVTPGGERAKRKWWNVGLLEVTSDIYTHIVFFFFIIHDSNFEKVIYIYIYTMV